MRLLSSQGATGLRPLRLIDIPLIVGTLSPDLLFSPGYGKLFFEGYQAPLRPLFGGYVTPGISPGHAPDMGGASTRFTTNNVLWGFG